MQQRLLFFFLGNIVCNKLFPLVLQQEMAGGEPGGVPGPGAVLALPAAEAAPTGETDNLTINKYNNNNNMFLLRIKPSLHKIRT